MDDNDKLKDTRPVCKYGSRCYQKNPLHNQKFKHPPKRPLKDAAQPPDSKKPKVNGPEEKPAADKFEAPSPQSPGNDLESGTINNTNVRKEEISDDEDSIGTLESQPVIKKNAEFTATNDIVVLKEEVSDDEDPRPAPSDKITSITLDHKTFIKEKFLMDMPDDFYNFWDFCKTIKPNSPADAFRDVGVVLVGPYDVLAGKFGGINDKSVDDYLVHWRYYYDPPELQTVIKGNDFKGFHIGYFRDDPTDVPAFLASNSARTDGVLEVMGPNIFAAIYSYLEDMKKTCNPFQKINIQKHQLAIKKRTEELDLELKRRNSYIKQRDSKIVTRLFNKIGLVVPYNRKTQLGYRGLALNDKDLKALLLRIKNGSSDQMDKFLNDLQPVLTYASIATDECDFGTGIELGLNILFFGVDSLNNTVATFLANSYTLLGRKEFATIAHAHMKNRRKGSNLSILD